MKTLISRVSVLAALSATLVLGQNPPSAASPTVSGAAPTVGAVPSATAPSLPVAPPPVLPEPTNAVPDAGLLAPSGSGVGAADPAPAKPVKPAAPKLPGVGVRGAVSAVDPKALTFTVAGKGQAKEHVVHIASSSRYTHNGKPATVADLVVGDAFNGRVKKNKQGEEVLIQGSFSTPGTKPASKGSAKPAKAKEAKDAPKDASVAPSKANP